MLLGYVGVAMWVWLIEPMQEKKPRKVPDSYFEEPPAQEEGINFTDMNISRPILKVCVGIDKIV